MNQLIWTPSFTRTAKKFFKKHPELKGQFAEILADLERDPLQPHLKLHPLQGEFKGLHVVSLTYSFRITLILKITQQEIILLDVGSHDDVYR